MANIHVNITPLVKQKSFPPGVGTAPEALRVAKRQVAPMVSAAFESTAGALQNLKTSLDEVHSALRTSPSVEQFLVTDNAGRVIAALGDFEYNGVVVANYFSEIHVGDPLNTGNPAQALFNAAGNKVTIGQNGIVQILDPFGQQAAWLGTAADVVLVQGAADNGSGLIRLTANGHTLLTGDITPVLNVGGVPNATGIFTVTKIDANHVDLQNSVFVGTYTSGGTVNRVLHVTGVANNGSGLCRVTVTEVTSYLSGDEVNLVGVGGVPGANGQFIITPISASVFDLQGSTFSGAYTSGGTCLRYFAGMLAQTFAIGPDFVNFKLRAFADGSLVIQNATFSLTLNGVKTTIDNHTFGGDRVGIEVQNISTGDAALMGAIQVVLYTTDPSNQLVAASLAHNGAAGTVNAYDGSGAGGLNTHGLQCILDGSNGNCTITGTYNVSGFGGITATRNMVASVSTGSAITAVSGPGVSSTSSGTFVTGVTLVSTAIHGGIVTS